MKRIISLLLCFTMLATAAASVGAEESTDYDEEFFLMESEEFAPEEEADDEEPSEFETFDTEDVEGVNDSYVAGDVDLDIKEEEEENKNPVMKTLYVSTTGNDQNNGEKDTPFKTVERAKQEVRKYNSNMTGDIVVNIASGTYFFDETLSLSTEDSGSNGYSVIYQGEGMDSTVISGGKRITGWKLYDKAKNIYSADAPGIKSRQMFVNGERRPRAAQTTNLPTIASSTENKRDYVVTSNNNIFASLQNITEVEVVFKKSFSDYRMPIVGVSGNTLIMPETNQYYRTSGKNLWKIENAFEFLDEEGEWYLNTSEETVYYKPKSDEDITKSEAIIAGLETIIDISGEAGNPVQGITVTGLTVKDCTWMGPNDLEYGYPNFQAGFCREFDPLWKKRFVIPNVLIEYADNVHFDKNKLTNLGGAGIWARYGVTNSSITGNYVSDVSQNGIMLGHVLKESGINEDKICDNVKVEHNTIHDAGIEYWGAVGIFAGHPRNSSVSYNEVYNIPYTCISFGWGWLNYWPKTPEKNDAQVLNNVNNKIIGNYVHDSMTVLEDGGGIYTLGMNPGLLVARNIVADMGNRMCFAYYMDNGSRWETLTENVSYNVEVVLYPKGADNKIYNNFFDAGFTNKTLFDQNSTARSEVGKLPIPEGHSNQIHDNTVVSDGRFPLYVTMNAGPGYEYQVGIEGNPDENIAAKATGYVIKEDGSAGKFLAGKGYAVAVDGNESTEMRAVGKGKWTADFDLGEKRKLTKMRLLFGKDNTPKKLKITLSEDGENYVEVPIETVEQDNEIVIDNVVARDVQIQVLEGTMGIAELELYADDFIPKKTAQNKMEGLTLVTFDDITNHWAQSSIEYLASLGVIKGMNEKEFAPDRMISRAEWIALATRVLNIQKVPYVAEYADIKKSDWFADNIQAAVNAGLTRKCFNGEYFAPGSSLTREAAALTLSNVTFEKPETEDGEEEITAAHFADLSTNQNVDSIDYIIKNGIMKGESENFFNASGVLTRAQAAVIIERVLSITQK